MSITDAGERFTALIVDDDPVIRSMLSRLLGTWNYNVREATDGSMAWRVFGEANPPRIIILDWEMPGLDGLEVCRRIRASFGTQGFHIILLTSHDASADVVSGLEAGADDYLIKPFKVAELRARLRSGERLLRMEDELARKIQTLEHMLERHRGLQGNIPICSYCKKVRDEKKGWEALEDYLVRRTQLTFTHTVCPVCYDDELRRELRK